MDRLQREDLDRLIVQLEEATHKVKELRKKLNDASIQEFTDITKQMSIIEYKRRSLKQRIRGHEAYSGIIEVSIPNKQ